MRILIVGAGALGSVFGCLLKDKGHQVGFVEPSDRLADIRRHGLTVDGLFGEHHCEGFAFYSSASEVPAGHYELVLVTVKSFHTAQAAAQIAPIAAGVLVISLQNGLGNYEILRDTFGEERTLGGRVIFGAEMTGPAAARVTVYAEPVMIGSPSNAVDEPAIASIAAAFSEAGIPTEPTDQITKFIWAKVLYNCALNPLSALLQVPYGRLLDFESTRRTMTAIVEEIFAAAHALGVELFQREPKDYVDLLFARLIPSTAAHYASMAQDLRAGRRTEIEALNGAIVRLGREKGVECPVNRVLSDLVRTAEKLHGEV